MANGKRTFRATARTTQSMADRISDEDGDPKHGDLAIGRQVHLMFVVNEDVHR
jgi:hypothetical protein